MTLNELMDVMNENQTVEIYDRNDDSIAIYDGRDSIPAVFNDVEVNYAQVCGEILNIRIDYDNNLNAIDYLKDRLNDIPEFIATNEYHCDNPDAVNQRIMAGLANVADDIRIIRANIANNVPWDDGMYI